MLSPDKQEDGDGLFGESLAFTANTSVSEDRKSEDLGGAPGPTLAPHPFAKSGPVPYSPLNSGRHKELKPRLSLRSLGSLSNSSCFLKNKEEYPREVHRVGKSIATNRDVASAKVEAFFAHSNLSKAPQKDLPTFDKAELYLGKFLGRGGFSDVDEIQQILSGPLPTKLRRTDSAAVDDKESRAFIAAHCTRPSGIGRYAVKKLRRDVLKDPKRCWTGIVDLVVETRFLANMEHPNIIKLRGIATCDPLSPDYFLVLDRLKETLQTRLTQWSRRRKRCNRLFGRLNGRNAIRRQDFLVERLATAFDLSAALEYMVSGLSFFCWGSCH